MSEKSRSKAPPLPLHTVEMLRACSSRLHISPKQAMDIAERLYTEVSTHLKQYCISAFMNTCWQVQHLVLGQN